MTEQGKGSGRTVLLLCSGLSRGGREPGQAPTSDSLSAVNIPTLQALKDNTGKQVLSPAS